MRTRILAFSALALIASTLLAAENFTYFYKRGEISHMRTHGNTSIERLVRQAKRWSGEYIWVERNGREYLIRDAATLAEVRSAFAEWDALAPAMREAERRMRPFEERMRVVEERVDRIGDQLSDDDDGNLTEATRKSLEARLEIAEREMEAVERDMAKVEKAMEDLEREMDRRERIAEARFEKIVIRAITSGKAERVD